MNMELCRRKEKSLSLVVAQRLRQRRRRGDRLSLADDFNVGGIASRDVSEQETRRRDCAPPRRRHACPERLACCCFGASTPAHQVPSLAGQRAGVRFPRAFFSFSAFFFLFFFVHSHSTSLSRFKGGIGICMLSYWTDSFLYCRER